MSVIERLDGFQRRHRGAGFPLAVLYKYFDDGGGYLAALITYYGFVSLFPLLLLASTVLGFVLSGDPAAQQRVLHSALSEFPVIGPQLQAPSRLGGGTAGVVIGALGALYGGTGVAMAVQHAMNTAWTVPKNSRLNPFKARARALVLLATAGVAVLATTALSILGGGAGSHSVPVRTVAILAAVVLNASVFLVVFRIATPRSLTWAQVAPGAIAAGVIWQLLQSFGTTYVGHVLKGASATNSVFALVLGLISFIYLAAVAVVFCVEVNVVRVDRLYPRALLTPMTDDVELTGGDERSYADQARAQRSKGFEEIDVRFRK